MFLPSTVGTVDCSEDNDREVKTNSNRNAIDTMNLNPFRRLIRRALIYIQEDITCASSYLLVTELAVDIKVH